MPKCGSFRLRDFRHTPVLMGIWFGCMAAIPVFALPFEFWLVCGCCVVVAAFVGSLFCSAARRFAAHFECRTCRIRWKTAEPGRATEPCPAFSDR